MAAKKKNPGYEFIVAALKKNPKIEYGAVRDGAQKKRLKIFPIMFGRAKAQLGLVKSKPRKKTKATKAPKAVLVKRGPGRPRKKAAAFDGTLESIVAAVKSGEKDKARYRSALERIQGILADVLD